MAINAAAPLELMGAPGSPYTRKMLAILRYRRIAHAMLWGGNATRLEGYPEPKVKLLPTFFFPKDDGALEAVVDSTFIIRRLEAMVPGRSVLPMNPALGFLDYLIEDFADEWLTKAMFHYRWAYQADIDNAGPLLTFWNDPTLDGARAEQFAKFISDRQVSRLYVVGSNATTAETIESSYKRTLDILDTLIEGQGFVLGGRPGAGDFALYGQLTQLVTVDPTPAAVANKQVPRIRGWIDRMDDLSGLDPSDADWIAPDALGDRLRPLLTEIGKVYAPFLIANAQAAQSGAKEFVTEIDGRPWTQPTFPYQAKCLGWIRDAYGALDEKHRAMVDGLLDGTGVELMLR